MERTIRMLPNIFRSRSIEDVLPAQKTPHSTRCTLNFVGAFSRELFAQFLKTSEFNQLSYATKLVQ